jgi:hypothetical protein
MDVIKRILGTLTIYLAMAGGIVFVLLWCKAMQPALAPVATAVVVLVWGIHNARLDRLNAGMTAASVAFYVLAWIAHSKGADYPLSLAVSMVAIFLWLAATARRMDTRPGLLQRARGY